MDKRNFPFVFFRQNKGVKRPAHLYLVILVGVAAISTAAPLIKLCVDAPAPVIAAARLSLAALVLLPTTLISRGHRLRAIPPHSMKYIFLAGVFLGLHFLAWITSLKHTSVVSSVVLVTTNPIFVGMASYFLLGERLHRGLILGILLAAAGGGLIALTDALTYVTGVYTVAALVLVSLALAGSHDFRGYQTNTYVYIVLLALIPQLLGHTAFNWALKHLSATTVTVFILGEPIGAGLLAYVQLGEKLHWLQAAGSGLVLSGIVLAARGKNREEPAQTAACPSETTPPAANNRLDDLGGQVVLSDGPTTSIDVGRRPGEDR